MRVARRVRVTAAPGDRYEDGHADGGPGRAGPQLGSPLLGGHSGFGRRPFPGGGSSGESPAAAAVATPRKARAAAGAVVRGVWGRPGIAESQGRAGRARGPRRDAAGRDSAAAARAAPQPHWRARGRRLLPQPRPPRAPPRLPEAPGAGSAPRAPPAGRRPQHPSLPWDGHPGPTTASGLLGVLLPVSVSGRTDYDTPSAQSTPGGRGDVGRWTPGWAVAADHLGGPSPTDTDRIPTAA